MTEEFKYRPPLKYFFVGICGLFASAMFGLSLTKVQIWLSIVMGIFFLMSLAMGVAFLTIFFQKFRSGPLKLAENSIEIPGRWKDRIKLDFDEIVSISEFDTYDHVIEIESRQGIHLIERNWMDQNEFDRVREKLREYWESK